MKLKPDEKEALSDAIDQMNESLDRFIEFYNEAEADKAIIEFDEEVIELIQAGKEKFGESALTKKINLILKEVLSFVSDEETES
ncbi:atypical membrane-integrating protein (Mistic protein) [Bacillus tianshenii]|uniref:atypical membrane-integrating protein (Mistic protein) n=1 Tax=Sutcliffiella tianshenii TaxID=1463404 RepID=UPI001CD6883A|nr:atypical membrane-integrating protein (Mistic protein) [Bacillus tianshenii]MCA1321818.1 atypical membrane-integrating protein (Mistic protein) [Bacillus tianshenii]